MTNEEREQAAELCSMIACADRNPGRPCYCIMCASHDADASDDVRLLAMRARDSVSTDWISKNDADYHLRFAAAETLLRTGWSP